MPKVLTLAGVSVLALALVLGMAVPALAAPDSAPYWLCGSKGEVLRGDVLSIGDQEFVIQTEEGELTISVDEDTEYYQMCVPKQIAASVQQRVQLRHQNQEEIRAQAGHGHAWGLQNRIRARIEARHQVGLLNQISLLKRALLPELFWLRWLRFFGEEAEFGDIAVGDRVVVLAGEDNLAQGVLIIKPTAYANVSGTITDISSSVITVDSDDGPQVTLFYDEDTVFVLNGVTQVEAGQYVHITYDSVNIIVERVVVYPEAP